MGLKYYRLAPPQQQPDMGWQVQIALTKQVVLQVLEGTLRNHKILLISKISLKVEADIENSS